MLKLFYTSLPFPFVSVLCFVFSFAMITLLVWADGGILEDRSNGGDAVA